MKLFTRKEGLDAIKIRIAPNPYKVNTSFGIVKPAVGYNNNIIKDSSGKVVLDYSKTITVYRQPGTSKSISSELLPNRRGVKTGLNILVDNPYCDDEVMTNEWADRILKGKKKALLSNILEYEFGRPHNYFTHAIELGALSKKEANSKYFQSYHHKIILNGGSTILHMDVEQHRLWYYLALASSEIANSIEELENGGNEAEWYIIDEEQKVDDTLSSAEKMIETGAAISKLKEFDNGKPLVYMIKALGLQEATDSNITSARALAGLYSFTIKTGVGYEQFMTWYNIWEDVNTRPILSKAAELYDYIKYGLVLYSKGSIKYHYRVPGQDTITISNNTKLGFIKDFLLNEEFSDEVNALEESFLDKIK